MLAAGLLTMAGAVFLYVASSPWLVWYTLPDSDHKLVIFSPHIPALPDFAQAQYFTSLPERLLYVAKISSLDDWQEAVVTLAVGRVPLNPVGLMASPRWFGEPVLITAMGKGKQIRLLAGPRRMGRVDLPMVEDALLEVPGTAFAPPAGWGFGEPRLVLPSQALHDAWNRRLYEALGFTATAPDILEELSTYDRVFMAIKGQESAVGMVSESAEQQKRWKAASEAWVVEEDRFRRPRENTFRLPDRSLGRETLAGLPREIFTRDAALNCDKPLPDAPVFYSCQAGDTLALANYAWLAPVVQQQTSDEWRISMGPEFLTAVPGVLRVVLQGDNTSAAGVVVLK